MQKNKGDINDINGVNDNNNNNIVKTTTTEQNYCFQLHCHQADNKKK